MLGNARKEDLASLKVNKKQHVETLQANSVDVEEVACECAGGLGT